MTLSIIKKEKSFLTVSLSGEIVTVSENLPEAEAEKSISSYHLIVDSLSNFLNNTYSNRNIYWKTHPLHNVRTFEDLVKLNIKSHVFDSWEDSFRFKISLQDGKPGLREPQIGALHAIHSSLTLNPHSTYTIVLPTGTGKTETMLAAVVSRKILTTLVVVPSDALRTQISQKFTRLGILRQLGVVSENTLNPVVAIVNNMPGAASDLEQLVRGCNVIVMTIAIAGKLQSEYMEILARECDFLIFDEAHHESATTWRNLSIAFEAKGILQFTATPYRNDQKDIQGKIVYNFPLKRAQELRLFSEIVFESICEFDSIKADQIIAEKAVSQLKSDIDNNYTHILMARTQTIKRANEVFKYYEKYVDLNPILINSEEKDLEKIKKSIISGNHKIIICVNMLGEGFDLPELKIAAMHDNHKSLPVFLQFIGRFARSRTDLGKAYIVANVDNDKISAELEDIWNNPDWNQVIAIKSAEKIEEKVSFQQFLSDNNAQNEPFPIQGLRPTLSTLIYDLRGGYTWNPKELISVIPGTIVYQKNIRDTKMFICVTQLSQKFDWLVSDSIVENTFNLYVFHVDEEKKLLFFSGTDDKSEFQKGIKLLCGDSATLIKGETLFRCFSGVNRVKLTNMGLYPSLLKGTSYQAFMGRSLNDSLADIEKAFKSKANFFGNGYEKGERVTIGCTVKGRIWSFAHDNLLRYISWCRNVGAKVLDDTITQEYYLRGFLIPIKITERPPLVPIAIDWPGDVYNINEYSKKVSYINSNYLIADIDLQISKFDAISDLEFDVVIEDRVVCTVRQEFKDDDVLYTRIRGNSIYIEEKEISIYFDEIRPRIWFENSDYLEGNYFFKLFDQKQTSPFNDEKIIASDWIGEGVNIKVESEGFDHPLEHSIQYRVISLIEDENDLVFNDDDPNEISDVIGLKRTDEKILVSLYHCKFANNVTPNGSIDNFYDVCGQAVKAIRKIENQQAFFQRLKHRENGKGKRGKTRIVKGDYTLLNSFQSQAKMLRVEFEAYIVQPGLSKAKITDDIRILLGSSELLLKQTHDIPLHVWCSI
jgi:superfamily II DNA or RNA helicase